VTTLDTRGTALTSLNSDDYGTFDFSAFTSINVAIIYAAPIWKVLGNFNGGAPLFRSGVAGPQDFSGMTNMTRLEVAVSAATSLVLPPPAGNSLLHTIVLNNVRIANQDIVLPAYAALTTLNMASGAGNIVGMVNTIDIAAVPTLAVLNLFFVGCKNIVWSSANAAALTFLELGGCWFATRSELGGILYGNNVNTGLLPLIRNAVKLHRIGLTYNSFSGTELAALITAVHGSQQVRPTTTSKTLALVGQDNNYPYPSLHTWQDANHSVVDAGSRAKLADLLRDN